jgi:hypothetical protein
MPWWSVRTDVDGETGRAGQFAQIRLLLRRFGKWKDCSGVESSKYRRFATSANSGKSVSAMMTMSGIGFDYACESSDEHGKADQLDASADAFRAAVRVAVRDGLAHPFLLTGDTGTTHGVHTRRAETLQRIHPQCR